MKISRVLAQAAKLVERGWHRGWLAVDAKGQKVGPRDRGVVAVCAVGAVALATTARTENTRRDTILFFQSFIGADYTVAGWNDATGRTGPEVACWLASASELAKVLGK